MPKNESYWLLKSEPETYSIHDLQRDGKTPWNGVRNFQARNFLREMKKGDIALIYHSVKEKAVVGVGRVLTEAYPDPDSERKGDWVQVDISFEKCLKTAVSLDRIKKDPTLRSLPLVTHSRLSVMPIPAAQFHHIMGLAEGNTSQ